MKDILFNARYNHIVYRELVKGSLSNPIIIVTANSSKILHGLLAHGSSF